MLSDIPRRSARLRQQIVVSTITSPKPSNLNTLPISSSKQVQQKRKQKATTSESPLQVGTTLPLPGSGRLSTPRVSKANRPSRRVSGSTSGSTSALVLALTPVPKPQATPIDPSSISRHFKPSPSSPPSSLFILSLVHILKVDPSLSTLTSAHPACSQLSPPDPRAFNAFQSLASSIISQQISGAAARTVESRFVQLFNNQPVPNSAAEVSVGGDGAGNGNGNSTDINASVANTFPTPKQVLATSVDLLRSVGLSGRKAEYITDLANHFHDGRLSDNLFLTSSNINLSNVQNVQNSATDNNDNTESTSISTQQLDHEATLLSKLTAVKGIGLWSAQMFAFFALGRADVFATGDLGVQKGVAIYLGKNINKASTATKGKGKWKYCTEAEMEATAAKFAPYRSLFMWYMWKLVDTDVSVLSGKP